jgi:hypothetical protein
VKEEGWGGWGVGGWVVWMCWGAWEGGVRGEGMGANWPTLPGAPSWRPHKREVRCEALPGKARRTCPTTRPRAPNPRPNAASPMPPERRPSPAHPRPLRLQSPQNPTPPPPPNPAAPAPPVAARLPSRGRAGSRPGRSPCACGRHPFGVVWGGGFVFWGVCVGGIVRGKQRALVDATLCWGRTRGFGGLGRCVCVCVLWLAGVVVGK